MTADLLHGYMGALLDCQHRTDRQLLDLMDDMDGALKDRLHRILCDGAQERMRIADATQGMLDADAC